MDKPVAHKLKDQLRELGAQQKGVQFSSDAPVTAERPIPGQVKGDTKAQVPKVAAADPLVGSAAGAVGAEVAKDLSGVGSTASGNLTPSPDELFTDEEVTLTEDERGAFLDTLVQGTRYERKFSLFDGRIKGRLRCRSTEESQAIAEWMNAGIREGRFKDPLAYAVEMRNILMAAQVMELNGTRYPELAQPLYRTQKGEDITQPGWLEQARVWSKQPEPVVAAVYEELRLFERKYWTMVVHAKDQNFWRPAGSTSR